MSEEVEELANGVLDAAFKVHTRMGPGLLEAAYSSALAYEVRQQGFEVEREVDVPFVYDGVPMGTAYRADLLVEGSLVVEVKA